MNAKEDVTRVVENYFKGYLQADGELIAGAFHPETTLYATDNGRLEKTRLADWLTSLADRKARGDVRQGALEIAAIDVSGTAATAKVRLTFPTFRFTDYLSLLEIEGRWRIIGKIYTIEQ